MCDIRLNSTALQVEKYVLSVQMFLFFYNKSHSESSTAVFIEQKKTELATFVVYYLELVYCNVVVYAL